MTDDFVTFTTPPDFLLRGTPAITWRIPKNKPLNPAVADLWFDGESFCVWTGSSWCKYEETT